MIPEGNTMKSTSIRLLAGTAAALAIAGAGAQAASASSLHYENHTYQVRTHRIISVECANDHNFLNFVTDADPTKGQVKGIGFIREYGRTVGITLAVTGPITFSFNLLCD